MGIFTFGEFVRYNHISLKSAAHMKDALKRYDKAFERAEFEVWAIDMAAKYFEYEGDVVWEDDNTWKSTKTRVEDESETITYGCDGWVWNMTYMEWFNKTDCRPFDMETNANEPGMLFYRNPVTGQWSDPYCFEYFDDYKEYIYPGVEDEESLYPIMQSMGVPGFNHGWDEESVKKEFRYTDLHDWAISAANEDFEMEKAYVRAILDREYLKERPEWGEAGLWIIGMFEKKTFWLENLAKLSHLCPDKGPFGIMNVTCGNYHIKISHYGFVMTHCGDTIATYWTRTKTLEVSNNFTKRKGAIKGLCMGLVHKYNF